MSGPEDLTDYQRGYVDGFDAPVNVAARAAAPPVEPDGHLARRYGAKFSPADTASPDREAGLLREAVTSALCQVQHSYHPETDAGPCHICRDRGPKIAALLASDKPGLDVERPEPWEIEAMIANGEEDSPDPVAELRLVRGLLEHEGWTTPEGDFCIRADRLEALLASDKPGLEQEERDHLRTIEERDDAIEWADRLAYALGGPDIGEHSNLNNPWQNALDAASDKPGLDVERLTVKMGMPLRWDGRDYVVRMFTIYADADGAVLHARLSGGGSNDDGG